MKTKTVLETERLILRGWEDDDAASLYKYARDERIGPAAGWPPHKDEGYSRAVIRTIFAKDEVYAICFKDDESEPIGSIGLTLEGSPERPLPEGSAELGFWVGHPYWGQGIAPEAVREMIRHGFEDLGLKSIYCAYFNGNNNSKRVQAKCGFKYHHTNTMCRIIMLGETRVEHFNIITEADYWTQKSHNFVT
jgi:RimJ/RimL family protein N-acetyltransferase